GRTGVVGQGGGDAFQAGPGNAVDPRHGGGGGKRLLIVGAACIAEGDGGRGLADGEGSQGLATAVVGAAREGSHHRVTAGHAGGRTGAGQAAGQCCVQGSEGGV